MNRNESIKEIRESLIERRDALRRALNGDDSLLRELSARQGGDEVDFAADCARGEISSQLAEVESRELHYVENAINRIHEDTYGDCEACGCRIPLERLWALPYASCCIQCKIKAEVQYKLKAEAQYKLKAEAQYKLKAEAQYKLKAEAQCKCKLKTEKIWLRPIHHIC